MCENGKTQSELSREYGVSLSTISRWVRLYSKVKTIPTIHETAIECVIRRCDRKLFSGRDKQGRCV
ncbi:MAG: helix-turn-helix domain-containing protein [Selenomonadaceae bacterium]|nr:helix-turn-helix domain-containing protein [Selenomonadaceae bacterium]